MARVLFVLLLAVSMAAGADVPQQLCAIAVVGGMLIDGNGGAPVDDSAVLIRGNRIDAVGPKGRFTIPRCAEVVSAAGKTVLPGLINSNTHLSLTSSAFLKLPDEPTGMATQRIALENLPRAEENIKRSLKILLMQGITAVRDTNGFGKPLLTVKKLVDRNEIPGSRVFLGTPLSIRSTEGYVAPVSTTSPQPRNGPRDVRSQ